MADGLNMSLDEYIKSNRTRGRSIGGDREFVGSGPSRRFANRVVTSTTPYSRPIQQTQEATVAAASETMLYISNLEYGVSDEDIKEIFSEIGELKRYGIHYDRSGRSKGVAEVVFARRGDALEGVRRYNNVRLDGKPMHVEIVGTNLSAPNRIFGNFDENYNGDFNENFNGNFRGRGGFMERPSGGFGSGNFGGGRGARWGGGRRGRDENVSADDLDAELDKYRKEAKETKSD